jgi:hypothetical protein
MLSHAGLTMMPVIKNNGPAAAPRPPARRGTGTRPLVPELRPGQYEVTFQTADGLEFSARLQHLTRHVATFEAASLAATWRASEVLSNFKILADTRVVYFGRAVVSQMMHTGDALLCEAKLDDLGSDTAFFCRHRVRRPVYRKPTIRFFNRGRANYRISRSSRCW